MATNFLNRQQRCRILSVATAMFVSLTVWADIISGGTYYLYNVGAQRYFNLGGTDNYTACLKPHGEPVILTASGTGYKVRTPFDSEKYFTGTDGAANARGVATVLTFTQQDDGTYTISNGTAYIGYGGVTDALEGGTLVACSLADASSDNARWQLLTRDHLLARLADATASEPVDATFLIQAPNIDRHHRDLGEWSGCCTAYCGSYLNNYCGFQFYTGANKLLSGTTTVSQKLTGLPAGRYRLSAQAFFRYKSNTNVLSYTEATMPNYGYLFAGNEEVVVKGIFSADDLQATNIYKSQTKTYDGKYFPYYCNDKSTNNVSDACIAFNNGLYAGNTVEAIVTDGTLTIGVKTTDGTADNWLAYDNFELYYLGPDLEGTKSAALEEVSRYATLNTTSDAILASAIEQARTAINAASTGDAIAAVLAQLEFSYKVYLTSNTPTTVAIDYTSLLTNADLSAGTEGWDASVVSGSWSKFTASPNTLEAYASSTNVNAYHLTQDITLAPGTYRLRGHAFYRWESAYNSDITNSDSRERALAYLVAGNNRVAVKRLGSESLPTLRPDTYANTMMEASAAFAAGCYENELVFTLDEAQTISLGYSGTHDREKSWFIVGPVTLEKISNDVLAAEAAAVLQAAKDRFTSLKQSYAAIAGQHTAEGVTFDTTVADNALAVAVDEAAVDAACVELSAAIATYMQAVNVQFDVTSLIANPDFETSNTDGWDTFTSGDVGARSTTSNTYKMNGSEGNYLFNTWSNSDGNAYNHFLLQTLRYLPAGTYVFTGMCATNQGGSTLSLVANTEKSAIAASSSSNAVKGSLNFTTDATSDVRIGVTSNRWFKADDFHLYYGDIVFQKRDEARELFATYESIAEQATDRSSYDATLSQARADLENTVTEADVETVKQTVRTALLDLLQNGSTATGLWELTSLIANPDISNASGWSTTFTVGNGIGEVFNNTGSLAITQTLNDMPAGTYTVSAQAFHRTTDYATARTSYLQGTETVKAALKLNAATIPLKSIFDETRFATGSSNMAYIGMADGSGFPDNMSTASESFARGQYWNTLRITTETSGDITFGLTMSGAAATNWLAFDNFHLYYGAKAIVNLDAPDAMPAVAIQADVTSTRTVTGGQFNAVCLPYDADLNDYAEVYELAAVTAEAATLLPARSMKAGHTYFVKPTATQTLAATDVLLSACTPDNHPALWDGTFQQDSYTSREVTSGYVLNEAGTALTLVSTPMTMPACTPVFTIPVSTGITSTSIPLRTLTDWQAMNFSVNIENWQAREYLYATAYTPSSGSVIGTYNQMPPARRDQPRPVSIAIPRQEQLPSAQTLTIADDALFATNAYTQTMAPGATVWHTDNFTPGNTYYYKVEADGEVITCGHFTIEGTLRMIHLDSGSNVRDLGGWSTEDGKSVRYGLIYRGGELHAGKQTTLSTSDLEELKRLGIAAELDLREDVDFKAGTVNYSALGTTAPYYYFNQTEFGSGALKNYAKKYHNAFSFMTKNLEAGQPTYFHCIWGADRTGAMAFLIEGLLGVSRSDIYKDYELTSFSKAGSRVKSGLDSKFAYILDTYSGNTQQEKFYNYLNTYAEVPADTLSSFISMMVGADAVIIDENESYTATPHLSADVTYRRSINKGFNTLVLPFDLTAARVAAIFGEGTEVYTLAGETQNVDGSYTLNFESQKGIPANTPVIINATCDDWTEQAITAIRVSDAGFQSVETEHFEFVPVSSATTIPEGAYFLKKASSELKRSLGATAIKPYRAYIAPKGTAEVKGIRTGITVGISLKQMGGEMLDSEGTYYDLTGRPVSNKHKGIVVGQSRKLIIR